MVSVLCLDWFKPGCIICSPNHLEDRSCCLLQFLLGKQDPLQVCIRHVFGVADRDVSRKILLGPKHFLPCSSMIPPKAAPLVASTWRRSEAFFSAACRVVGTSKIYLFYRGIKEDIPSSFSLPVIFIVHVTRGGHAHLYANLTTFSLTLNGRRWHERSQERVTQNGWMTAARHNEIRKWLRQCIKIVESLYRTTKSQKWLMKSKKMTESR
jgi:hypothetical protein